MRRTAQSVGFRLIDEPGEGPVIIADPADNPGGGGSGDTTELLRELIDIADPHIGRTAVSVQQKQRITARLAPQ